MKRESCAAKTAAKKNDLTILDSAAHAGLFCLCSLDLILLCFVFLLCLLLLLLVFLNFLLSFLCFFFVSVLISERRKNWCASSRAGEQISFFIAVTSPTLCLLFVCVQPVIERAVVVKGEVSVDGAVRYLIVVSSQFNSWVVSKRCARFPSFLPCLLAC